MSDAPVGIFDSGLGGLSIAREIRTLLPAEPLLYLADSAHCPYGGRSLPEIQALSMAGVDLLVQRGAKARRLPVRSCVLCPESAVAGALG